jgi:hypothetical protein
VSEATPKCIYCSVELDDSTRLAHVIPECLGGRLTSKKTCCSDCNQVIGKLEEALCDELRPGMAMLRGFTGDGREVVQTVKVDGTPHTLRGGRLIRPEPPPRFERDSRRLVVPIPAGGLEVQARTMARQLWNSGRTPDQVRIEIEPDPNPLPANLGPHETYFDVNIGGSKAHRRVFVKMALELLERQRPGTVRRLPLWKARKFVRNEEGDFPYKADHLSDGSGLASAQEIPEAAQMIEVWTHAAHLLTRITFFGRMSLTASLCSEWPGPRVALLYAANPIDLGASVLDESDDDGPPLAVWHDDLKPEAIAGFDRHFHGMTGEVARADSAPIEREPCPDVESLRAAVRDEFAKIVAKKGPPKPARKP